MSFMDLLLLGLSIPVFSVQRAVLYRFAYVVRVYYIISADIGNSSCNFKYAVIASCRKTKPFKRRLKQPLRVISKRTKFFQHRAGDSSVTADAGTFKACKLNSSCTLNAFSHRFGAFAR